ncbi:sulfotransferase [Rapidithrix thailandica]|uniref:Sulfotransferase n=1 Tax=Rapidithrix thailandica TaxID=413964 RepID=A0AAW9S5B2_9BACT
MNQSQNLPRFIIIGAMKAATTSLYYYLSRHPEVNMSSKKETDFFLERCFHQGLEHYQAYFENNDKVKGEASTNYTKFPHFKGVPERIRSVIPEVKLIYILRDPIERLSSEIHHAWVQGYETRSLEQILGDFDNNNYVYISKYYEQLSQYLKVFDEKQLLILTTEQLRKDPETAMQKTFRFIGVNPEFSSEEFHNKLHVSSQKTQKTGLGKMIDQMGWMQSVKNGIRTLLPDQAYSSLKGIANRKVPKVVLESNTVERLLNEFRPDVDKMREFTGYSFSEWRYTY